MKYLVLLLLATLPFTTNAAISRGSNWTAKNGGSGNVSFTVAPAGANPYLVVSVMGPLGDLCPSTISWNGYTLNKLAGATAVPAGGRTLTTYGGLVAAGSATLSINCSGADLNVTYVQEYDGVGAGTSGAGGATTNTSGSATSFSVSTTTIADNSWVVSSVRSGSGTLSAGSNTLIATTTTADANFAIFDSNGAVTPAGSRTLNFNNSPSAAWGVHTIILEPVAAAAPTSILGLVRAFWIN